MTRDRARKKAIRARMAASGEPYNVAARGLDASSDTPSAGDALVREVVARVTATLAAPSARFSYRRDADIPARPTQPRQPGPVGRLVGRALGAAWKRLSPEWSAGEAREMLRESFVHQSGVGVLEPTARRYQIDHGGYAQLSIDGELYGGPSGHPLRAHSRPRRPEQSDPFAALHLLLGVTVARHTGVETLRGTPCTVITVQTGPGHDDRTVWIDDDHVRRIEFVQHVPRSGTAVTTTFELWDVGAPLAPVDWTHLPRLKEPG